MLYEMVEVGDVKTLIKVLILILVEDALWVEYKPTKKN